MQGIFILFCRVAAAVLSYAPFMATVVVTAAEAFATAAALVVAVVTAAVLLFLLEASEVGAVTVGAVVDDCALVAAWWFKTACRMAVSAMASKSMATAP